MNWLESYLYMDTMGFAFTTKRQWIYPQALQDLANGHVTLISQINFHVRIRVTPQFPRKYAPVSRRTLART